jgi:hypothetical protein
MMNNACHAIPTAKQSPKYFRLRSIHAVKSEDKSTYAEEAEKATYSQGTAKRTHSWIMEDTPSPVDGSPLTMPSIMAIDTEPEISENGCHPLMVFFFKNSPKP